QRIFRLAQTRGSYADGMKERFEVLLKVVPVAFRVKQLRSLAKEFFSKVNISKLRLDEADWYRCFLWGGWKFGGVSDEHRASLRMMIDAKWQHETKGQKQTI